MMYPFIFKSSPEAFHRSFNAPTERFFRSLKYEQLNYEKFKTKAAAKSSIIDYLAFYNGRRSHSALGYKAPIEFEREFFNNAA